MVKRKYDPEPKDQFHSLTDLLRPIQMGNSKTRRLVASWNILCLNLKENKICVEKYNYWLSGIARYSA